MPRANYAVMFWHDGQWKLMHSWFHDYQSARDAVNEYKRGADADRAFRIVQIVESFE